jgi:hypothetical protein
MTQNIIVIRITRLDNVDCVHMRPAQLQVIIEFDIRFAICE